MKIALLPLLAIFAPALAMAQIVSLPLEGSKPIPDIHQYRFDCTTTRYVHEGTTTTGAKFPNFAVGAGSFIRFDLDKKTMCETFCDVQRPFDSYDSGQIIVQDDKVETLDDDGQISRIKMIQSRNTYIQVSSRVYYDKIGGTKVGSFALIRYCRLN